MTSDPIEQVPLQVPFTGASRFFTNDFVQIGERVTYEWAPTTERRALAALALVAGIFDALVIAGGIYDGTPLGPVVVLVLVLAPLLAWIAASASKTAIHVSNRGVTIERFARMPRTHRFEDVARIEIDDRGRPRLRMITGALVDPKLRLPHPAQDVVVEEMSRRLAGRTMPTYRVAPEPSEDRPITDRNHLPRREISA